MDEVKAYCMKCKTERVVKDAQVVTTKNGRRAAQGTCPVCGTKIFKFLPKEAAAVAPAAAPVEPAPVAAPTEPAPTKPAPTA
jgi:hypothetical protein